MEYFEVVSKRSLNTPSSPIRKLVPFADATKKQGIKIYHLNIGQPDIKTPARFLNALKNYPQNIIAYENSLGLLDLRKQLSGYYAKHKIHVTENEILITTGASEAILFALLAICDPSDECLVFEPFYANYLGFAAMANVNLKAIPTDPEDGFKLPKQSVIEKLITKKTKAIIACNPNNPTGTVYGKDELRMLNSLSLKHKLFIISDETYREFVYDGAKHHSFLTLAPKQHHVLLIDSFSKRYSLCGARIGCLVTKNSKLMSAITKFAQTRLSAPTVEQYAACQALKTPKTYLKKINLEYQKRRDVVIQNLQQIPGVLVKKPSGAFYCVAGLPVKDAEHFAKWLLTDFRFKNQTIMVAPAQGFYLSPNLGKNEIRIAYVLNSRDLTKAMHILKAALLAYPDRK